MKIGVIDVGGGYRGIYAAGILDYCMDNNIHFDLGIGVSAGSANLISYAAGQPGRNYKFYTEYGNRKECTSARNFITKGTFIDLDYAYSTLSNSNGENSLDFKAVKENPMEYYVVAVKAETGQTEYFSKNDIKQDDYNILKASCAIPFVCHPYNVDNIPYFDGGIGDPIPIKKAFELGCDKVVLILTKPIENISNSYTDIRLANLIKNKYPNAANKLYTKSYNYDKCIKLAEEYQKEGKVLIIAPDDTCGVTTLKRDKKLLDNFYKKGYKDGKKIEKYILECQNKLA